MIVQVVPRVDRDERFNVGVFPVFTRGPVSGCRLELNEARLRAFAPELDVTAVSSQLDAIRAVCAGDAAAGPIARLPTSERFHWLSAPRSTVVQPSPAHAGLCDDPAAALDRAFRLAVA